MSITTNLPVTGSWTRDSFSGDWVVLATVAAADEGVALVSKKNSDPEWVAIRPSRNGGFTAKFGPMKGQKVAFCEPVPVAPAPYVSETDCAAVTAALEAGLIALRHRGTEAPVAASEIADLFRGRYGAGIEMLGPDRTWYGLRYDQHPLVVRLAAQKLAAA